MSENLIPQVRPVELEAPGAGERRTASAGCRSQGVQALSAPASAGRQAPAVAVQMDSSVKEQAGLASRRRSFNPLSDVMLKFKVDAKTNDVTILIVDRASRKVVRSIPSDEMARMDPGELLELFT
jgi:hypothetical protein